MCLAYFPTRSLYRFNEEDLITWLFEKIVGIGNVEGGYNLIRGRQLTFWEIEDMLKNNYVYYERK